MGSHTKLSVGDWIRLEFDYGELRDFPVEEFRQCLGVFVSEQARQAGNFTPLCNLYGKGPCSQSDYISNYGSYLTNQVPQWMNIPKREDVT